MIVDIPETGELVAAKGLRLEALVMLGRAFSFPVFLHHCRWPVCS